MPVYRRGNSWRIEIMIDGKRFRETRRTKKEALEREREIVAEATRNEYVAPSAQSVTFREFAPLYLEWAKANKAPLTYRNEHSKIETFFVPTFGRRQMNSITSYMIERYKLDRRAKVSPRTVNIELQLLSVMFAQAMKWGHVRHNPVKDVERLRLPTNPPRFLSDDEIARLLAAARTTYLYPLVLCALHTGMRKSELLNLTWNDLDFATGTITVQSKADWQTKSRRFRTIEMTEELKVCLGSMPRESGYVFTYAGKRITSNVKKTWRRILCEAKINNCTLHTLRHTFASHLAMQGVPLMHIQQLLGHQDYDTTLIYAHLSRESVRGQVHKLPFAKKEP